MNLRPYLVIATVLVAAGCATKSAVIPAGKNTYLINNQSATTLASGSEMLGELYQEASKFCAGQGKTMESVDEYSEDGILGAHRKKANARLKFKCVDE